MSISSVTLHDVSSTLRVENLLNEDDATLEYLERGAKPPSQPEVSRNISALTTIRYSCITNGKRT